MKNDFWRRAFDRNKGRHETTGDSELAEKIVNTTRDHVARDFPNPQREGCPSRGAVFNSFRSGRMPKGEERAHILSCSECFNEYQIQLREYRAINRVPESAGGLAWWPRIAIPGLAFVLLLVAIAITVSRFFVGPQVNEQGLSHTTSPSSLPSPMVSNSAKPDQNKPEDESQKQSTNSMIALNQVTIDFEQTTALRRLTPQQSKTISLSPTPYALLIRLPDKSPRGSYTVSLNNAFGKSVRSKPTASSNGKTVRVTFNLTGLNPGGYSICVTREQEAPSCLPVTVLAH